MDNPAVVPPHPNDDSDLRRTLVLVYYVMDIIVIFIVLSHVFPYEDPQFRVDSFSLSNFTLIRNDSSSAIAMAAQVQLTVRNPNKKMDLSFGLADANVLYRSSWSLGPTVLPAFSLGAKSKAPLTASFAAVVETDSSNGNVARFDLRLFSSVRYKERVVGERRNHVLMVFCDGLVVGIPSNINGSSRPGGLIGGAPRPCGVLISRSWSS